MYLRLGKFLKFKTGIVLFTMGIFLFYNNCGNINFTSDAKSKTYEDPFKNNKFQVKAEPSETTIIDSKNNNTLFQTGSSFSAVLNQECLATSLSETSISAQALRQLNSEKYLEVVQKLPQFTLKLTLEKDLTFEELRNSALADSCLIGLTNIYNVQIKSLEFNDPMYSSNLGLLSLHSDDSYEFFNHSTLGATSDVVVAVIDSGFDFNNADLKNSLLLDSHQENGHNFLANSGNIQDDNGHGTSIASIIAAPANNRLGIVGVMPHNVKIYPLKVLDKNLSSNTNLLTQAIEYAAAQQVDVINLSLGGGNGDPSLLAAMNQASNRGIFISVAAGNSGGQVSASGPFPAAYCHDISGCMTVGSVISNSYKKSSFSEYSSTYVDIMAPGEGGVYTSGLANKYESVRGTSFSTPFVSGAAALTISFLKNNNISYDANVIETILKESAIKSATLKNYSVNGNALDLASLKSYLSSTYLSKVDGGFDED